MIEQAIDLLNGPRKPKLETGVDAKFFRINDKWGFKFYGSPQMAELTYEFQGWANEAGLAPKLGEYQEFDLYQSKHSNRTEKWWGYITECVDGVLDNAWKDMSHKYPGTWRAWDIQEYKDLTKNLRTMFRAKGVKLKHAHDLDMHIGNVGFIGENLVCFDFSGPAALELSCKPI